MSEPEPVPDPEALRTSARRYGLLATALAEAGARVARLSRQIAEDWPDAHGREWADRADRLCRELGRDALASAELGEALAREAAATERAASTAVAQGCPAGGPAPSGRGMRLGGTDSRREDDGRGMRIAELPSEHGPPGG